MSITGLIRFERSASEEQSFCRQYEQDIYHLLGVVEKQGMARGLLGNKRSLSDSLYVPRKNEQLLKTKAVPYEIEWLIDGVSSLTVEAGLCAYSNLKWWHWQKSWKWLTIDIKHQREMVFYLKSLRLLIGLTNSESLDEMTRLYEELKHFEKLMGKGFFWKRVEGQVSALMCGEYHVEEAPYGRYLRNSQEHQQQHEWEWRSKFYQGQITELGNKRLDWYVFWKKPISQRVNIQGHEIDGKAIEGEEGIRAQVEKYRSRHWYSLIRWWQVTFTSLPSRSILLTYHDAKIFSEMVRKNHDGEFISAEYFLTQNTYIHGHATVRRKMPVILSNVLEFYGGHSEILGQKLERQSKEQDLKTDVALEISKKEIPSENVGTKEILGSEQSKLFQKKLKEQVKKYWRQKLNAQLTMSIDKLKKWESKLYKKFKKNSIKRTTVALNSAGIPECKKNSVKKSELQNYQDTINSVHSSWVAGTDFLSQDHLDPLFALVKSYQAEVDQLINSFNIHKPADALTQHHMVQWIQAWIQETYEKLKVEFQKKIPTGNVIESNFLFDELLYERYFCQNLETLSKVSLQSDKVVEVLERVSLQSKSIFTGDYTKVFDFFNTAYPGFLDVTINEEKVKNILLQYLSAYDTECQKIKDSQMSGFKKESEIKERQTQVIKLLEDSYIAALSKLNELPGETKKNSLTKLLHVIHSCAKRQLQKQQKLDEQVLSGNFEGITEINLPSRDIGPGEWFLNTVAEVRHYKIAFSEAMLMLVKVVARHRPAKFKGASKELDDWFTTIMNDPKMKEIIAIRQKLTIWRRQFSMKYHPDKVPSLILDNMHEYLSSYTSAVNSALEDDFSSDLNHQKFRVDVLGGTHILSNYSVKESDLSKIDRLMYEIGYRNNSQEMLNSYLKDLMRAERKFNQDLNGYKILKSAHEEKKHSEESTAPSLNQDIGSERQEANSNSLNSSTAAVSSVDTKTVSTEKEQKDTYRSNTNGSFLQPSRWSTQSPPPSNETIKLEPSDPQVEDAVASRSPDTNPIDSISTPAPLAEDVDGRNTLSK